FNTFATSPQLQVMTHLGRPRFQRFAIPVCVGIIPWISSGFVHLDVLRAVRRRSVLAILLFIYTRRIVCCRGRFPFVDGKFVYTQVIEHLGILSSISEFRNDRRLCKPLIELIRQFGFSSRPSFSSYKDDTIGRARSVDGGRRILEYRDGFDIVGI